MKRLGIVRPETKLPPREADAKSWQQLMPAARDDYARKMAVYAAMIDRMDQNIGRLLAELQRQNRLDDTLVLFLSDNGACRAEGVPFTSNWDKSGPIGSPRSFAAYGYGWANASNTPLRRYKAELYEGGIASPLIARYPKLIPAGSVNRSVGHIMDLMPTCLKLAGVSTRAPGAADATVSMEGMSLLPALRGETLPRAAPLCWEHLGHRAVRDGDWKLVAANGKPWELYNLADDPTELLDLAQQYPERVTRMASEYATWAESHGVLSRDERKPYQISPQDYRRQSNQRNDSDKDHPK
jgi:arylsulfatase